MSLIDEIRNERATYKESKKLVIREILDYFDKEIRSNRFEKNLKTVIFRNIHHQLCTYLSIEFHDDENVARFEIKPLSIFWETDSGYALYKGVDLDRISSEIIGEIWHLLDNRLQEFGLIFKHKDFNSGYVEF